MKIHSVFFVRKQKQNLQKKILKEIRSGSYDFVWIDKGNFINRDLLEKIRSRGVYIIHYTQDHIGAYSGGFGAEYFDALDLVDLQITTNHSDASYYENMGYHVLLDKFCLSGARAVKSEEPQKHDIIFIGHHEPYTELVIRRLAAKFNVALYGTRWLKLRNMAYVYPQTVWGDKYYHALISAKMGICIYSRHNLNTNQIRPYELAYAGTFILAERSKDLVADFQDGVHCACFSSPGELLTKAEHYLHNDCERLLITKAAKKRVDQLVIDKVFLANTNKVYRILESDKIRQNPN